MTPVTAPPPQDAALLADFEKELAKLARAAKDLDTVSTGANKDVGKASEAFSRATAMPDIEGESRDSKHKEWIEVLGGVRRRGARVGKTVQRMKKTVRRKPKAAAKKPKPSAERKRVQELKELRKLVAKAVDEVRRVAKGIVETLR